MSIRGSTLFSTRGAQHPKRRIRKTDSPLNPSFREPRFPSPSPPHNPQDIMERKTAQEFDQELLYLYDYYAHGMIDRRTFLDRAAKYAVGGLTALALLEMLSPNYLFAAQVPKEDNRVKSEYLKYSSPEGNGINGEMRGLFARPANATGKLPGIIVVHENRGLNPYIEDVTRRCALAGFVAFAPDALYPLGGYPTTRVAELTAGGMSPADAEAKVNAEYLEKFGSADDKAKGVAAAASKWEDQGVAMQRSLNGQKITEDFVAATKFLAAHPSCNGKMGVTGFCFGGGMANTLAWRLPDMIKAAAPYYGAQASAENAAKIKAELVLHYGELDTRINAGWPAYEAALKAAGVKAEGFIYPGVNHGFHNDTTPRYDKAAAELSWERTIALFKRTLT
jgi:carboxymethylenebutenolidase